MASVLQEESRERRGASCASVPRLWVRPAAARDNLVVITAEELIIASVRRDKLSDTVDALELGQPNCDVLQPNDTRVPLGSIVSLVAPLGRDRLVVEYEQRSRKFATHRFAVYDADAQGEIVEEVLLRMGPRATCARTRANRLLHVMKPFNLLMAIAMLMGGFHYLAANTFKIDARGIPRDMPGGGKNSQQRLVQFRKLAARLPKVRFVPFAGTVVLAAVVVTGFLLVAVGYQTTLLALMTGAGLAACWTVKRLLLPPVTVSVFNNRFR